MTGFTDFISFFTKMWKLCEIAHEIKLLLAGCCYAASFFLSFRRLERRDPCRRRPSEPGDEISRAGRTSLQFFSFNVNIGFLLPCVLVFLAKLCFHLQLATVEGVIK